MAMREANLFFTYVRREFPDSRSIVEDYSNADKLLDSIHKAPADIYVLSTVGDKKTHHLKLAQAIRARYRNNGILFVVHDLDDLKNIINASIAPDYVFVNEATEPEIEKFFSTQGEHKVQRRLLPFTMDGRKQIISIQTIISVQAADKKVSIQVFDRAYITALTIAELEQILPDSFVRIDKGTIINSEYIRVFDPSTETAHLTNGQSFPVSRRGQKRLFEAISSI